MNSGAGDTTQLVPGYPIRTPWDHSSVDSSPRPIAASHVLHRLLVPRHPPSALDNLTTKMLASTMHISTNNQPQPHRHTTTTPTPPPGGRRRAVCDQSSDHTRNNNPTTHTHRRGPDGCSLRTQQGADTPASPPTSHPQPPPPGAAGARCPTNRPGRRSLERR
jgi:hypothetical protein